jgi:hypothetical protein
MRATATPTTAAVTGGYCSIVGFVLGPLIDKPTSSSSVWLIVGTLAVGLPAYFFVFGVTREEMVSLWVLQPALLKRIAACFVGAVAVASVASVVVAVFGGFSA